MLGAFVVSYRQGVNDAYFRLQIVRDDEALLLNCDCTKNHLSLLGLIGKKSFLKNYCLAISSMVSRLIFSPFFSN
jgi:hypothetical protein